MKNPISQTLPLFLTRIRPSLGNTGIFLLIYGAYTSAIYNASFLLLMLAYTILHNGGDFLNDKYDYLLDLKNQRLDKFTTNKILTPTQMGLIAVSLYVIGLTIIGVLSVLRGTYSVLAASFYFVAIITFYSLPSFRMRQHPLLAYLISSSVFAIIPISFAPFFALETNRIDIIYSAIVFFQFTYILVQKDITDKYDLRSIFRTYGQRRGELLILYLSAAVFITLVLFAFDTTLLILPFAVINLSIKLSNWYYLHQNTPERRLRITFVSLDYLSILMCGLMLFTVPK